MPDTGWKLPGTVASVTGSGTQAWTAPGNAAIADDGSYASVVASGANVTTNYLVATSFSFGVPSGASIKGVEFRIRRRGSGASSAFDEGVYLYSSSVLSANKITRTGVSNSFEQRDVGGANDLWGVSLSASDVNSSSFGAAYQAFISTKIHSSLVATVWMRIHYEEEGDDGNFYERVGGVWRKGALSERVSGVYRSGKLYERVSGVWRS